MADMLIAIHRRDPAQLRDAVLEVATVRKPLDERGLERALARFIFRHFGRGSNPDRAMLTELLQIFLALGIVMPPTTSLLFHTLATLEGTLCTLCLGYPSSSPRRPSPPSWSTNAWPRPPGSRPPKMN